MPARVIQSPPGAAFPASATRGFTLLELLAGIAVFALLAGIVLGGIRLGVRSWNAAAERSAGSEQMRIVHHVLRRQLSGTLALATSESGRWQLQFEGEPESLTFVTEFPGYVAGGGAQRVSLAAASDAGEKRLLLRWWPVHAGEGAAPADDAVLLEGFSALAIRYFGAVDRNAQPRWREDWRGIRQLPQLVKIDIRGADGEPWPPLVVPLKVDAVSYYRSPDESGAAPAEPTEGADSPDPVIQSPAK